MKYNCKHCGKAADSSRYYRDVAEVMESEQICFSCYHWREQNILDEEEREPHTWAIVNGTHYVLCPDHPDEENRFKGFGGALFVFLFNDGTLKKCTNTWCQGDIKIPYWREKMPDNARLIWLRKEEREAAEMYALCCISLEDVEYLLGRDAENLSKDWYDYAAAYSKAYDQYMEEKFRKDAEELSILIELECQKDIPETCEIIEDEIAEEEWYDAWAEEIAWYNHARRMGWE